MKNVGLLLLAALLSLPLASCDIEGDTVEYVNQGSEVFNITVKVSPQDWQANSQSKGQPGYYLTAKLRVADITPSVISSSVLVVYLLEGTTSLKAIPLPTTRSYSDAARGVVTETLSYELESGYIIFRLSDSDFQTQPYSTPLAFRVAAYL